MRLVQRIPVLAGASRVNPVLPETGTLKAAQRNPLPSFHSIELAASETATNCGSIEIQSCVMRFNFLRWCLLIVAWQFLTLFHLLSPIKTKDRNFFRSSLLIRRSETGYYGY